MSAKSNNKKTASQNVEAGKAKTPGTQKERGENKGGVRKLTAPELPASMKWMLNDEKGEHKYLLAVRVTFLRNDVTENEFLVRVSDDKKVWMRPIDYDEFMAEVRAQNRSKQEGEAAVGWAKKLGHRCLIFPKAADDTELVELMSVSPVPKIVLGMMGLAQSEFATKYPNADSVLDFWLNASSNVETKEKIVEYASQLNSDYVTTLADFEASRKERARAKAEKQKRALQSESKKKVVDQVGSQKVPPKSSAETANNKSAKAFTVRDMAVKFHDFVWFTTGDVMERLAVAAQLNEFFSPSEFRELVDDFSPSGEEPNLESVEAKMQSLMGNRTSQ